MRSLFGGRFPVVAVLVVALAGVAAVSAAASPPGTNGQITFARFNPTLGETFSDDGSQNGIHTIRSSDGGGLTQITSNPGGDDVPGSWSSNGKRIVFQRFSPTGDYEGVFVANLNGTGLKRILPPTMPVNCCTLDWSPLGNELV